MHARSALFDLYGDHLRARGGEAPVAALVALLTPLGISPPAVRTAVSRMVKQNWLTATVLHGQRGYALTRKGRQRLDETAARIYRTRDPRWEGTLDLVMFRPPTERSRRARLGDALRFHGYGPLSPGTWISPWHSTELEDVFVEAEVSFDRFTSRHHGDTLALTRRAWDLDALARRYREFVATMERSSTSWVPGTGDELAYTVRCELVHAFRVFLFSDPQLPGALCPPEWAGSTAAAFFDAQAARLRPAADRFVDRCLNLR